MAKPKQVSVKGSQRIKVPEVTSRNRGSSTNRLRPVFSFEFVADGFNPATLDSSDQSQFLATLEKLSEMSWQDIQTAHRHGLGHEKIARGSIRKPIPPKITPDVDFFIAFRFNGKKPMIGWREDQIFHLVWVDPAFEVYNHG